MRTFEPDIVNPFPPYRRRLEVAPRVRAALVTALLLLTATAGARAALRVESVVSNSPAAAAGLQAEDRILRFDGRQLLTQQDLDEVMAAHRPGDTVPLSVERGGKTIDLELTFGERPGGGVSIGVGFMVEPVVDGDGPTPEEGAAQCLAWIDETYRVEEMARELKLDPETDYETIRACVRRDALLLGPVKAVKYCDNVFKVHCSGVDLLTEIGEALVGRCEAWLSASEGLEPRQDEAWKTCAQHKVFERYSMQGESSDEAACKAAWNECTAPEDGEEPLAWSQWGGPNQDFRAPAAGLAASWPAEGPEELWSRALGEGYSAILAEGGRLYTMYRGGDDEVVVSLDAATGKTLWEHRYEHRPQDRQLRQFGEGPNSTPLIAGDLLFTVGIAGKIHALEKSDGNVVWTRELWYEAPLEGNLLGFGYSSSPVAFEDMVIVTVGGENAGLAAFDQGDGRLRWTSPPGFENSYSSPRLVHVAGRWQLLAFMAEELIGVDPATGELLWRYPHANQWKNNISMPAVAGEDMVLLSSPQAGTRGLRLAPDGDAIRVEEVWSTRRVQFYHGSTTLVGDWVYGSTGTASAFMTAVNVRTGEVAWRERGFAKANCVEADGKLVILDENGMLYLAEATPEKLEVHGKTQLLDKVAWTVPTIVGRTLYVRDRSRILALDLG